MKALQTVFVFLTLCSSAFAEDAADRLRVEQVVAALNLGAIGIRLEQAEPLVIAREMLAELAPTGSGIIDVEQRFEAEARFLLRGDPTLARRLDALMPEPADRSLLIEPLPSRLNVPSSQGIAAIAVSTNARLISVTRAGEAVCVPPGAGPVWSCDPARARGTLDVESKSRAGDTPMIVMKLREAP